MAGRAVRWLRMHRSDPETWGLMPAYIERVREAGKRFNIVNIDELCTRLEAAFVVPIETITGWVVLDASNEILGHVIVSEDILAGRKVGWITQAVSTDPRRVSRAIAREVLADVERWARGCGYAELAMLTSRRETRAWERSYQFTTSRLLMTRPVTEG